MSNVFQGRVFMVKKGTIGYGSVMGHYNFFYPEEKKECEFISDCIASKYRWMEYEDFVSVVVPKGFVKGETLLFNQHEVLWVKVEDIQAY